MISTQTIIDTDGVVLVSRVHRQDIQRLCEKRMVRRHKRHPNLWHSLTEMTLIRAELRPKTKDSPVAEGNRTYERESFSNPKGAGWYYTHHDRHAFDFPTTAACAAERYQRRSGARKARTHAS